MKTKFLSTVILVVLAMGCVSAQNNRTVKRNIDVSGFTSINASGGWDVYISQGSRQSVSIEISEEIADYAVVEVKGNTLHIYNKRGIRVFSWNRVRHVTLKAYVTVTNLTELQTSGGVDIIFETPLNAENFKVTMSGGSDIKNLSLNCHSFKGVFSGGSDAEVRFLSANVIKVDASGGSDVELYDIDAGECRVSASGGCDVELYGRTEFLKIDASGGCDVSAEELMVRVCEAGFSGAADGKIHVTDNLDISVSGASDVICYGNPRDIQKNIGRTGSLKIKGN